MIGNSEENLNLIYNMALELIENKELSKGKELLEKIYNSGNRNIDGLNILGIISYLYCDFEEARRYWYESLELCEDGNEARNFLIDIESYDFQKLNEKYNKSLEFIENKNYEEAISIIEDINKERSEFIETKELLSLLYMVKNKKMLALNNIKLAKEIDIANIKFDVICESIKMNNSCKSTESKEDNEEGFSNFTVAEVILNLIMILNYKVNEFYGEELKNQNIRIEELEKRLEMKELEIEKLRTENLEISVLLEEIRFRNESALTREISDNTKN